MKINSYPEATELSNDDMFVVETEDGTKKIAAERVSSFGVSGVVVSATAPDKLTVLWIDTANGGVPKYYNGTAWVPTKAVWG